MKRWRATFNSTNTDVDVLNLYVYAHTEEHAKILAKSFLPGFELHTVMEVANNLQFTTQKAVALG
jgi:hypothetical protein